MSCSSASSQVLHETFPQHTFLMNGLIQGVKVGAPGGAEAVSAFSSFLRTLAMLADIRG